MGDKVKQPIGSFTPLYEQANVSPPLLDDGGSNIATEMRRQFPDILGDVKFSQGPVKVFDRAAAKLVDRETGKINPHDAVGITDLVRGRIVVETPEQINAIREFLANNADDLGIKSIKDRFAKPSDTHYRDINLTVELENGHMAEIQINQRNMLAASDYTHDAYEEMDSIQKRADLEGRDITADEKLLRQNLEQFTQDLHDRGAAQVFGIDSLLNEDGRAKLDKDYAKRTAQNPAFKPGETINTDNKFGPIIEKNPDFLQKAEINGGSGYKALRNELGITVDSLPIDTSGLEPSKIKWDAKNNTIIAESPEALGSVLKRQTVPLERYTDMGVGVKYDPDLNKTSPVAAEVTKTKIPAAPEVVHARASAGVGAAGLALGVVGLTNSIQEGEGKGIAVSGLNVGTGALDVGLDAAEALGRNAPMILRGIATKANIAATVVDGAYQISKEEGTNNKLARGAAVTATAGTGVGLGMAAAGVTTAGAAATVAVVTAPVVATVLVGVAADEAVESYKITEELNQSIKQQERPIKVRNETEVSGAPKLSNYSNLKLFAVKEGATPNGVADVTPQEKSKLISEHEYSKDPDAVSDLETRLQAKINHYDKIIDKNDSWVHDSIRIFGQDEVDAKQMAQIDRAHYMAAMNELKQYKQELADNAQQPKPPQGVINHGTDVSAVLPAGATLTVQSSDNNASVMRGVAPDNQIRLMQTDGQSSSTLADIERQRNIDQLRAAERAATAGQPPQQTAPAQMGAR